MPRDYKHRADAEGANKRKPRARAKTNNKRKPSRAAVSKKTQQSASVPFWRWGLVIILVALFAYFLNSLSSPTKQEKVVKTGTQKTETLGLKQETAKVAAKTKTKVITKKSTCQTSAFLKQRLKVFKRYLMRQPDYQSPS